MPCFIVNLTFSDYTEYPLFIYSYYLEYYIAVYNIPNNKIFTAVTTSINECWQNKSQPVIIETRKEVTKNVRR